MKIHPETRARVQQPATRILAASSATDTEIANAKKRGNDGSKPVSADKAPYRPKEKSTYFEPTYFPDDEDMLEEVLNTRKSLWKHK